MGIFQTVAKLFGRERDERTMPVYGLSAGEVERLKGMKESEAYDVWLRVVDIAISLQAEAILSSRNDALLHESRGIVLGLRRAASLIDEVIHSNTQMNVRSEQRVDAELDESERRKLSLYGTAGWGRSGN